MTALEFRMQKEVANTDAVSKTLQTYSATPCWSSLLIAWRTLASQGSQSRWHEQTERFKLQFPLFILHCVFSWQFQRLFFFVRGWGLLSSFHMLLSTCTDICLRRLAFER